jgi:hypothetical protein
LSVGKVDASKAQRHQAAKRYVQVADIPPDNRSTKNMRINKYTFLLAVLIIGLTSCDNTPSQISSDNYYQLRKQLFKYRNTVDQTKDYKILMSDCCRHDTLENKVDSLANSTFMYIDSVKAYLLDHFKVSDPNLLTIDQIKTYDFKDSLFSYVTLNSIFCGELGEKPDTKYNAYEVKNTIQKYYKSIPRQLFNRHALILFYPNEYEDRKGVKILWEYQHFYNNNLITTLTNLEKLKHDIYLSFEIIKRPKVFVPCTK